MKLSLNYINDIVDETYSRYNANMLDNQDPFGQIENNQTGDAVSSNYKKNENAQSNKKSTISNFFSKGHSR